MSIRCRYTDSDRPIFFRHYGNSEFQFAPILMKIGILLFFWDADYGFEVRFLTFLVSFFQTKIKNIQYRSKFEKMPNHYTLLHMYAMHTNESVSAMRLNRAFACGRYSFRAFINAQNFSWISRILVVLLRFMKIVIYVRLAVTQCARAHYSRMNPIRTNIIRIRAHNESE